MIKKSNFTKWLAFAFPYIAQLLFQFINFASKEFFHIIIDDNTNSTLFLLINSFSILLGIKVLSNYTHTDNCKNYQPKNYKH